LPIFYDSRWGSQKRELLERARSSEFRLKAELDKIRGALGRALATWERAIEEAETYRISLVPSAHKTLVSTFAAYQVNRADFASLYQAERRLLEFEQKD